VACPGMSGCRQPVFKRISIGVGIDMLNKSKENS
jgi:hypothetical protein